MAYSDPVGRTRSVLDEFNLDVDCFATRRGKGDEDGREAVKGVGDRSRDMTYLWREIIKRGSLDSVDGKLVVGVHGGESTGDYRPTTNAHAQNM